MTKKILRSSLIFSVPSSHWTKACLLSLCGAVILLVGCATNEGVTQENIAAKDVYQVEYAEIVKTIREKSFLQIDFNKSDFEYSIESLLHALDPEHLVLQQADVDRLVKKYAEKDLAKQGYKNLNGVVDEFVAIEHGVLTEYLLVYVKELIGDDVDLEQYLSENNLPDETWTDNETNWQENLKSYVADDLIYFQQQNIDPKEAEERLAAHYSRLFGASLHLTFRKRFEFVANALMKVVDSDSSYFLNAERPATLTLTLASALEGIGVSVSDDFGSIKVGKLFQGGPADQARTIYEGDRIIGISQDGLNFESTLVMSLDDAIKRMRGKSGTKVHLQLRRQNKRVMIAVQRGPVKLKEQVVEAVLETRTIDSQPYRLGVITVPSFYVDFQAFRQRDPNYKSSTRDVKLAISDLRNKGAEAIILDLRNNGGGSLSEGRLMSALFIEADPVMQIFSSRARKVFRDAVRESDNVYKGPLIVLVNQHSAGSSEIVAGTVQDYGVGVVVGQRTFGFGVVQSLSPTGFGAIKLTENEIYRVTGRSYQIHGVQPDVDLEGKEPAGQGNIGQRFKRKTVQPGELRPADFTTYNRVDSEQIKRLKIRYIERIDSAFTIQKQDQSLRSQDRELAEALRIAVDLIQVKK